MSHEETSKEPTMVIPTIELSCAEDHCWQVVVPKYWANLNYVVCPTCGGNPVSFRWGEGATLKSKTKPNGVSHVV